MKTSLGRNLCRPTPAVRLLQGLPVSLLTIRICRLIIVKGVIIIIIIISIVIFMLQCATIYHQYHLQAKVADLPESVDWRDQGVVTMVILADCDDKMCKRVKLMFCQITSSGDPS